ncbi:MAG: ABC transporter permease [Tissierellia bacterium]|nr:ABC transporter permease [Tissierellia bacterium]
MELEKRTFADWLNENKVVVLFVILCVLAIYASGYSLSFVGAELFTRIGRNGFTVLSLLIPVLAGMGLNFGITIGAIAAQIAVFWVVYWGFEGIQGFLICVLLSTPIAMLFGFLVGKLFNKMKGSEMIAGMVLGYFADGLYQFFFLFVIGGVIPVVSETLLIAGNVGVKNTIDLAGNLKYALDTVSMLQLVDVFLVVSIILLGIKLLFKYVRKINVDIKKNIVFVALAIVLFGLSYVGPITRFLAQDRLLLRHALYIMTVIIIAVQVQKIVINKHIKKDEAFNLTGAIFPIILMLVLNILQFIPQVSQLLDFVRIPVTTYLLIALLCLFNNALLNTVLGQNMRTVGQSRVVANSAGIDVDKTRVIAMIFSTVLACWGQLIYLQNIGTFSTYGAHTQVGQFAIAALLVGGASVQKATNKQAIIGVILFHTLFIVAPQAGKNLFDNAQLGEYFRVFVAYGVIAVSLAMHAWNVVKKPKEEKLEPVKTSD